ncbi:MAG: alpha-amylase/4-alpha-glucanotransferase domain-containing protein [Candidatus Omnitrophota bacterium]
MTDFAMAIHFHQPVGNFDHVMERACDKCYIPFLDTLRKYPDVRMTFHFTGCLLEWVEKNRPEMVETVKGMVKSRQVEVMSGGFYEPILPSIPVGDRLRQIRMLSDYVRSNFSFEAKGAWVAERVWEPELPSILYDAGIKYVILDETHFLYSGIPKKRTYGYYMTEDSAKPVAVFPSDKVLRYFMPFRMPEETIGYMRGVLQENPNATFIYGDDGEKFGEWPGTHQWVFGEKWLEKFFDVLMQNADWLKTSTMLECLEKNPPLGKVYLPTVSYDEMMEWALPADTQELFEDVHADIRASGKEDYYRPFIRGGFWRNFLAKYPESDHMNKKMIYVSKKLDNLRGEKNKKTDVLAEAEKNLFRGQCNCAYWHGVFGGLYLFHLRNAIYHHLVKCETLMDEICYGNRSFCKVNVFDLDADGSDDIVLENKDLALYIDPAEGGILKELDSKAACHNLINTLARRKEAYHRKIIEKIRTNDFRDPQEVKTIHDRIQEVAPGIEEHLVYDGYSRCCLVDHFLSKEASVDDFLKRKYEEKGDFVGGKYDFKVEKSGGGVIVIMKREGTVEGVDLELTKKVTLPPKGSFLDVKYVITNTGRKALRTVFAPEFSLTMPDGDSERYRFVFGDENADCRLGETGQAASVKKAAIVDAQNEFSVQVKVDPSCRLWHVPIKTASQSERAYELNYQGSAIVPAVAVDLEPGGKKELDLRIKIICEKK